MKNINTIFYSFLALFLFISCTNNTTSEENKEQKQENTITKEKTSAIEVHKNTFKNGDILRTLGAFDTDNDKLHLHVPVSSDKFTIEEVEDISSDNINAIVVRVSNGDPTSIEGQVASHITSGTFGLKDLDLDTEELEKDKQLKIITFNSMVAFTNNEIKALRDCIIKGNSYDVNSCINSIRTIKLNDDQDDDPFIPNDRKGSIIFGR